jgi:hypothetical protein
MAVKPARPSAGNYRESSECRQTISSSGKPLRLAAFFDRFVLGVVSPPLRNVAYGVQHRFSRAL